jgi:hypothetical protein
MALVGRQKLDHPARGTSGATPTLHTAVELIYTQVSDAQSGRFFYFTAVADSTTVEVDHNFGADFADYTILLYTGTHPNLTRVPDPAGDGWTIAAQGGNLKTKIDVTTPGAGGPHTFVVIVLHVGASLGGAASATTPGLVTSYSPLINQAVHTVASADYTILDGDGYHTILVTTGASDRTMTLPTAADNEGRELTFKKLDAGVGKVIIDGEGAETIDGATTYQVVAQYAFVRLVCDGSSWNVTA